MMGYSGLGMQNWIYKRKLHKPFSKRGKVPSFKSLPLYSRTFSLKPKLKVNSRKIGIITVSVILMICTSLFIFGKNFHNYSSDYTKLKKENKLKQDIEAFSFLINSGKNRLGVNNINGAYLEFVLAYRIMPDNEEIINLLIETSSILCISNKVYCGELDKYLNL